MHELSLAMNVVNIAEREIAKAKASKATSITLEIGECAGVEKSAFKFAWSIAVKGTSLEEAERIIEAVEGKAICQECNEEFALYRLYDPCPNCGAYARDIFQGKEFRVKSLTVI